MIGKDGAVVRFTSISPLPTGCADCAADENWRAFCTTCRGDRPCAWCAGRGFRVREYRWVPCDHTT